MLRVRATRGLYGRRFSFGLDKSLGLASGCGSKVYAPPSLSCSAWLGSVAVSVRPCSFLLIFPFSVTFPSLHQLSQNYTVVAKFRRFAAISRHYSWRGVRLRSGFFLIPCCFRALGRLFFFAAVSFSSGLFFGLARCSCFCAACSVLFFFVWGLLCAPSPLFTTFLSYLLTCCRKLPSFRRLGKMLRFWLKKGIFTAQFSAFYCRIFGNFAGSFSCVFAFLAWFRCFCFWHAL